MAMSGETQGDCVRAANSTRESIGRATRFPANVFVGKWTAFRFFDSDHLFDLHFIDYVQELMSIEGSTCSCLLKIESGRTNSDESLFIRLNAGVDDYRRLLHGDRQVTGWVHGMGSFACSSNLSTWCIYCERESEIAVMAIRERCALLAYEQVLTQRLHALSIDQAIRSQLSFGFSPAALSSSWSQSLLSEYNDRS
jgi:hypothetical protein